MNYYEFLLPGLILIPLIGAIAILIGVPGTKQQGAARLAFGFSLIPLLMVLVALCRFDFSAVGTVTANMGEANGKQITQVAEVSSPGTAITLDGHHATIRDLTKDMSITVKMSDANRAAQIVASTEPKPRQLLKDLTFTGSILQIEAPRPQLPFNRDWLGLSFGTWFHLGMDSISLWLVVLTAFLTPLSILASFNYIKERQKEFYAWMLILLAGMLGVFCAQDVLLFYLFFEFTLIPMYFIIGIWGGSERRRAAGKFFLFTFAGSVLTLVSIVYVATQVPTGMSFKLVDLYAVGRTLDPQTQMWVFMGLLAGFAVKVPLFPVHTWLPLAHTEAPTAGSVILAGVLLKLGTYGLLRFAVPMLPVATMHAAPTIAVVCVIGVIYGALVSWVQGDMKKLIAYSSVSHLAFCVLGMFALTEEGLTGSVLYMINHGLSTGALFLIVGMIYERYHTRDMNLVSGIVRRVPVLGFFAIFFVLSSVALPGLNGFVSEFLVLMGTFVSGQTGVGQVQHFGNLGPKFAIPAATGVILGAVYMLYWAGRVVFGPLKEPAHEGDHHEPVKDLSLREWAVLLPIAVAVVVMGVAPKFVMDSLQPPVRGVQAMVMDGQSAGNGTPKVAADAQKAGVAMAENK